MGLRDYSTEQLLLGGAAIVTVAFLGVATFGPGWFEPDPDWGVSDGCLGGLEHEDVGISYHYHPSLKVTIDGNFIQIPASTGIDQSGCREGMRWIHVHNVPENPDFTTLHVETPDRMNVPVGAFFEIWEREGGPALTDNKKFDVNNNGISDWEEYDITMKVNGEEEENNYESFVMEDLAQIELSFNSKSV